MSNYDYFFKYIIIGDPEVGKSSIIQRYINNEFNRNYSSTIGVEFHTPSIELNKKTYKIQIWDTGGKKENQIQAKIICKGAICAFIVYDITNKNSFNNITSWVENCKNNASEKMLIILIGNKSDLNDKRQVNTEEGQDLADKLGISFFETSCNTGENVNNIFEKSLEEIQKRIDENYYDLENNNGCTIKRGNKSN